MKKRLSILMICFFTTVALADWDPGDPFKMHFPQLPNPDGWDIDLTKDAIQDDFMCSWSGPINDVHFWVSWEGDRTGGLTNISWIDIGFLPDVPADPLDPLSFSHPGASLYGNPLWAQRFITGELSCRPCR